MKKEILLYSIMPLVLGSLIYILFRSNELIMFNWFEMLYLSTFIEDLRTITSDISLPYWVVYNLPNALWLFSFTSYVLIILGNKKYKSYWTLIPIFFGIGIEMAQYFSILNGTFDIFDLLTSILSILFSFYFLRNKKKILNHPYILSSIGCFFFIFLAYGSSGPADGLQDFVIKNEKDSVKRMKMRKYEEFYIKNSNTKPNEKQKDSINNLVDSIILSKLK